jgi:hypothetical protein
MKKTPIAIAATLAVGVGIGVTLRPSGRTAEAVPVDPTWTLLQLTGYDADGELVTIPIDYHPLAARDLFPDQCIADINGDGVVDLADLDLVLANFGKVCE